MPAYRSLSISNTKLRISNRQPESQEDSHHTDTFPNHLTGVFSVQKLLSFIKHLKGLFCSELFSQSILVSCPFENAYRTSSHKLESSTGMRYLQCVRTNPLMYPASFNIHNVNVSCEVTVLPPRQGLLLKRSSGRQNNGLVCFTGLLTIVQFMITVIVSTISHVLDLIFQAYERVATKPGVTLSQTEAWKTPAYSKIILQSTC